MHYFVHEEGIALRLAVDRLDQGGGGPSPRRQLDEARHVGLGEAAQQHALAELAACQLGQRLLERVLAPELHVAVGPEQEQTRGAELSGQELQEQQRGLVRPVQVVDHEGQRLHPGGVRQEGGDAVEEPEARLLGLELGGLGKPRQPLAHLGDHLGDVGRARPHLRQQGPRLAIVDVGPDDLHPGPVGRGAFALVAAAPQDLGAAQPGVGRQLLRGARLADARLAHQHEDAAASRERVVEGRAKLPELPVASHEDPRRQAVERLRRRALLGGDQLGADRRHPRQLPAHRRGALGTLARILRQQPQDQRLERARDLGVVPRGRHRRGVDVLADHRHHVVAQEGRPARRHLVEKSAQCVEIGTHVNVARQRLLGGHVGGRADHHALLRDPRAVERERQAEVAQPGAAVLGEPDVAGLEVAVDHAALVRVLEGPAQLLGDAQRLRGRESAALGLGKAALQVASRHVLAHDVEVPVVVTDVVDGHDVGMVAEPPHGLGLARHASAAGLVEALGLDQGQRDLAVEPLVAGQVDALLGALAEQALHLVAAGGERARNRRWRRLERRSWSSRRGAALTTAVAELGVRPQLVSAARADRHQAGTAAVTEGRARAVLSLAGGTAHGYCHSTA